jgi:pimeloyl-ACP methyl ester carboxylesterase
MLVQRDGRVFESLVSIRIPALVLVGAGDTPFLQATDVMAARIPGATKVVIASAGHASNIDQPDAFNDAVLAFLTDVEAASPEIQSKELTPEGMTPEGAPEGEGTP